MKIRSRRAALVSFLLAACLVCWAKDESVPELVQRAQSARLEDQPALYTKLAELQLKAAEKLYDAGNPDVARSNINDVASYSGKAADASVRTGKKLKSTEISLRKMAEKLRDMKRTLNFDDQAPVQEAADKLESLRTDLLSRMFGKKSK
jgi:hypothetical protein